VVARHKRILLQRIGTTLMRGQALQILATVTGTPFARLAEATRYIHSRFAKPRRAPQSLCGAPTRGECLCGGPA
jgi:hypothetical protein